MTYIGLGLLVATGGGVLYRAENQDKGLPNPVVATAGRASNSLPDLDDSKQGDEHALAPHGAASSAEILLGQVEQVRKAAGAASVPTSDVASVGVPAMPSSAADGQARPGMPEASKQAPTSPAIVISDKRLERLERNVRELIAGLRSNGYLKPLDPAAPAVPGAMGDGPTEPDVVATDFNPYPVPLASGAARAGARSPSSATVSAAPVRRTAKVAPKPAAPASQPQPPQGELLSVDIWDGRPSAVIGTGTPGDSHVRVMNVGDSHNGVTLKAVDVASQRATFNVAGRDVQLSVEPANAWR